MSLNFNAILDDIFAGGSGRSETPEPTVRDADDSIVAHESLPQAGGQWLGRGDRCEWTVFLSEIEPSDFDTVSLTSAYAEERTMMIEVPDDNEGDVTVGFRL